MSQTVHFVHYQLSARTDGRMVVEKPVVVAPPPRTPRPMNSWLLFRAQKVRDFKVADPNSRAPQAVVSRIVSEMWKNETPEVKRTYYELAERCRADHKMKYPNYKLQARSKGLHLKIKAPKIRSLSTTSSASTTPSPLTPTFALPSSSSICSSSYSASSSSLSSFDANVWNWDTGPSYSEQDLLSELATTLDSYSSCGSPGPSPLSSPAGPWNPTYMSFEEQRYVLPVEPQNTMISPSYFPSYLTQEYEQGEERLLREQTLDVYDHQRWSR